MPEGILQRAGSMLQELSSIACEGKEGVTVAEFLAGEQALLCMLPRPHLAACSMNVWRPLDGFGMSCPRQGRRWLPLLPVHQATTVLLARCHC